MTPADAARLQQAGITLPPLAPPIGYFLPAVESGGLLWVSGQAALDATGQPMTGKVGIEISLPEACRSAGLAAATVLAAVATTPGRIRRLRRVVRIFVLVNATPDTTQIMEVLNGCNALFADETQALIDAGTLDRLDMPVVILAMQKWHRDRVWQGWSRYGNGVWNHL